LGNGRHKPPEKDHGDSQNDQQDQEEQPICEEAGRDRGAASDPVVQFIPGMQEVAQPAQDRNDGGDCHEQEKEGGEE
jgi:hypothetical protein